MKAPTLHGRDEPLAALRGALDDALHGRGHLVLVSGEAGIGKSAVAAALARDAEARGATVTWGRAWEFADAPPYFPVRPCLKALGVSVGSDPFQLWEDVVAALASKTAESPAVWILEDLHAADLGTLDLLALLAQPLRALRAVVVATVRDRDARTTERMTQRLARMARDGLDVRLAPLADREIAAITEQTLGRAVPADALRRLAVLTGGNPLFVVECARAFRAAGGIEGTLALLPPTIRQVVLDRVELLPDATQAALACGAVLGREFAASTVARMQGALPAGVIDSLLPALRAGVVTESEPGRFVFSHALVRDAIEDALGVERRAELHGRAEQALAPLGDEGAVLVERARHALSAARGGAGAEHVVALVARATALLEREGAFDRAFELGARLERARADGTLPPATPEESLHFAQIARAAGRSDVARRTCESVIAQARTRGDVDVFARAVLQHASDVRPGIIDREQLGLLEEARALYGGSRSPLACRVLARLATALQPAPDPAVPEALVTEALAGARATGDDEAILHVLELANWALYAAPLEQRHANARELRDRALAKGDLRRARTASISLALQAVDEGDFAAFDRGVDDALVLAANAPHARERWRPLLLASMRAVASGRWAEAERHVTEASQLDAVVDDPAFGFALGMHHMMRMRSMRRDDLARACNPEELFGRSPNPVVNGAIMRAGCAAIAEDVAAARAAIAIVGKPPPSMYLSLPPVAMLAEAYALAGTDEQRREIRDRIAGSGEREVNGDQMSFHYDGPVVRILGLLDASLGDLERAEEELREAHRLASARGHAPWVAQIGYELAKVVRRRGREADARVLLAESARLAHELGMTSLAAAAGSVEELPQPSIPPAPPKVSFVRDGSTWIVARGARTITIKDARGVQLLARLVEQPNQEIHVLALASDEPGSVPESDAGEMLDDRARAAYKRRLEELEEAIAGARERGDAGRGAKLETERDALLAELRRATGLGGRTRPAGSATEKARVNVQRRLKDAVARIAEADAELGRLFERAVRTGTYCCFRV